MKKLKKALSLLLVICMVASMAAALPGTEAKAADNDFYKIVHLDCGRKYFSPENIKKEIDTAASAGYNQVELYLSDNQGFRFALDDMSIQTDDGKTYDLTPALGDGYSDGSKYPDGSGKYLTQSEMTGIISYAKEKGIEIVPCINVPGHMGAILEEFPDFRYSGSKSSIDLENEEAVAFALAITEKYASYFAGQGVQHYNLGADEYANDMSTMGFQGLYNSGKYQKFVDFLNSAAKIVENNRMTPRAFNDGICYNNATSYSIDKSIEVCYWSSGWSGYNVASASTLNKAGYKLINTHGDYYWVLGNSSWQCSADKASKFDYTSFQGGTVENPAGAMFCIWCDVGNADGQDEGASVVSATKDVITAFGASLPQSETSDTEEKTVTCTEGAVSVTAKGLTSVNCEKADAPVIEGAAEGKVKAYDVKPQTADGAYTNEGKVSITVPEGWNTEKVAAFVVTDGKAEKVEGSYKEGKYSFTAPHFSVMGIYEVAADEGGENIEVTENKTITVTVGGETTATIEGANYADNIVETELDKSTAIVTAQGSDGQEASATYTKASVTCNNLISSNSSSWRAVSGYYYQANDGNYYPLYAKRSSSGSIITSYTYTWGYSTTSSASNVSQISTQSNVYRPSSSTPNITVYKKSGTAAVPASTTVTFKGVKEGKTYVTVGNTRYTINVVAEDLNKVDPLPVEFWITNRQVTANGNTSMTIAATASGVYSETGAKFSDLVPAEGAQDGNTMVFWKGTRLADGNHQTAGAGVDRTTSGTDFTYVRYWSGSWAYSADGESWTNVADGDQIVAYYLQKTEVTDEVETQVVDWGVVPSTSYSSSNFVLLDYAVKYESGEITPSTYPTSQTMGFHCETSTSSNGTKYRTIGMVRAEETADYEVYMITLTPTSDNRTTAVANNAQYATDYKYNGTEKVVWVDDEANLGDFADESLHYTSISGNFNYSVGGDPIVPGLEIFNRHGMLVTYYVRAKVTEDSLSVHYIDQTANQEFYNYNIAVKGDTLFDTNIGLADPWKGNLANGSVTNLQNKTQTVSADLSTMPAIGAQYRYSDYTCTRVTRSDDGKEVYLYYTFNNAHSFVADFGLPLNIKQADLNISGDWTSSKVSGAKYGTATVDSTNGITYTPTETLKGVETLQLTLTNDSGSATHQIYIYPATTVYYEEGFAELTGFSGGSKGRGTQATEAVGSKKNVYGYDSAYAGNVGASANTQASSSAYGDKATFTFTGTGVGIYANCTTGTGRLMIQIKNTETNKIVQVQTALVKGVTDATKDQAVTGYNVPVTVFKDLPHATYDVTISHIKKSSASTSAEDEVVNLDGFRVYNTLGTTAETTYAEDKEENVNFTEVRDLALSTVDLSKYDGQYGEGEDIVSQVFSKVNTTGEATSATGVILSNNTDYTADELKDFIDNGPKNEVYLYKGQTLVLNVNTNRKTQVGLKALDKATNYKVNTGGETTLNASTDMFYEVSQTSEGTITITNTSDGILSVTMLKICDAPEGAIQPITEENVKDALTALGYVEPEEVETPDPTPEPAEPVHIVKKIITSVVNSVVGFFGKLFGRK